MADKLSDALLGMHYAYSKLANTGGVMSPESVREFTQALLVLTLRARALEHENERFKAPRPPRVLDAIVALQEEAAEMRVAAARGEELLAFARRGELKPPTPRLFEATVGNTLDQGGVFGPPLPDNDPAPRPIAHIVSTVDLAALEMALQDLGSPA
ncbi:MAG: hypothetical protein QM651_16920 [Rhodoblastus sp.]